MNRPSAKILHDYLGLIGLSATLALGFAACDIAPAPAQSRPTPSATIAATSTPAVEPPTPTALAATAMATGTPAPSPTDSPVPSTSMPASTATSRAAGAPSTVTAEPPMQAPTQPRPTVTSIPTLRPTEPAPTQAPATSTPAKQAKSETVVLATGFGNPDDLIVSSSGDIYFGDFGNGAINILRPGGKPEAIATGLRDPEGIAIARDGALIVAEQITNRILEIDPSTGAKKVLRQLVNNTGQDGADGVALDPATGDILIPDSPYGRILRMSRDGSTLKTLATGFVRPTGIAVEADGNMIVADEFGNEVYRLSPSGVKSRLAHIFQPDDIALGPDGSIYANSLGGDIVRINQSTGGITVIASGLKLPHGLGVDPNGNVIIAESGRNRIMRITP